MFSGQKILKNSLFEIIMIIMYNLLYFKIFYYMPTLSYYKVIESEKCVRKQVSTLVRTEQYNILLTYKKKK